ncbi:MAG TPA: PQQ-binding-like beta-propeller repeat protein [Kofleriaceae bacterium]|nr:PQQ-binding-like beta-propeller repeat protein [Kofleriaceae bacterium]
MYAGPAHGKGVSRARCIEVPSKWRIEGFGRSYALKTSLGYVAVGSKDPGTAFPILVGVDPRGKVKWRRGVSDDDGDPVAKETPKLVDAVGGAVVVAYKLEAERWRLAALDEATGATRWRRDLGEETHWAAGMTLSDERVYVLLSSTIAVHDLSTGKELAVLKSR